MLSKKPMSFSELLEALGVSSSFLTYHLDNLGELVAKIDDGKYRLSGFGEAVMATMTKVEDIPTTMSTKPRRIISRNVAIALGLVCIILAVSLTGTFAYYAPMISDKNNTISSLNNQMASSKIQISNQNNTISSLYAQISKLNSNITSLQKQITSDNASVNSLTSNATMLQGELNSILNGSKSLLDIITSDPSAWVNKTVEVEGNISLYLVPGTFWPPWDYELSSNGTSIGVSFGASNFFNGKNVTVRGVVTEGRWYGIFENGTAPFGAVVYFIEAESIELLE